MKPQTKPSPQSSESKACLHRAMDISEGRQHFRLKNYHLASRQRVMDRLYEELKEVDQDIRQFGDGLPVLLDRLIYLIDHEARQLKSTNSSEWIKAVTEELNKVKPSKGRA